MITEGSRHALFRKLEHILGPEEAVTLMEHLPPVGWADVATKEYLDLRLDATEQSLRASIKDEIGKVRDEMTRQTRAMVLSISGLMVTVVLGIAGVVVALTG